MTVTIYTGASQVSLFHSDPPGATGMTGPTGVTGATAATGSALDSLAHGYARQYGSYVSTEPDWLTKGANITDDSGAFADPLRHQFGLMGGGHGVSQETDIRLFNTTTGVWSSAYASTRFADMLAANEDTTKGRWINTNQPMARHTYSTMVVRGNVLHVLATYINPQLLPIDLTDFTGQLCRYDLASIADPTTRWTFNAVTDTVSGAVTNMPWQYQSGAAVDQVSNKIIVFGQDTSFFSRAWLFDPDANTYTKGPTTGANAQPTNAVYCPDNDKFYQFQNGGVVCELTLNRSNFAASTSVKLTTSGPTPPLPGRPYGYPSFSWDPIRKRCGGSFVNGVHYEFDPIAKAWTATTVLLEAGSTGVVTNDFATARYMTDVGCYVMVTIATSPHTWVYRP